MTNGWTDRPSYRDARTHLKTSYHVYCHQFFQYDKFNLKKDYCIIRSRHGVSSFSLTQKRGKFRRTILLRSKSIRRGDGRRNRLAAWGRTTIGPKRHQLNTIWHRVNTKLASKLQSKNADIILNTLTSFSIHWRHSQYVHVIPITLMSFLIR